jgi:choline kinase
MQAVILAGGVGSRLRALSGGKPKCLVEVGGRPLILHQLEALADHGVGPVLVVLGYQAEAVKAVIGERAETVVNHKYEETNSLYSLWLAREWVKGPFVLLNCDLFFDPDILDRVLEEEGNVLAYDSTSSRGREQTKVAVKQRRVMDLGKDLPAGSARGESLGLLKFDDAGAAAMMQMADALIRDGHETAWVIEATRAVCQIEPIYGINIAGLAWTEIDFPYDLDVARREVWPKIYRGRWRQLVYWKRTRWAALAGLLATFALTGWVASERVGPASVDWETVPPAAGTPVRLERHGREQRWWAVPHGERLTASVTGPKAVVEVRLVLPDTAADSLRYVVAVTLDDRVIDWQALTATRDTSARISGAPVGDKDRIELTLPPGGHQLGVTLSDAHAKRLLVRVRQPDEP